MQWGKLGGGVGDGSRSAWKDRGRVVITVRSPETSDTAAAAVHLHQLTLLFHFCWHKSFCRWMERLFTLSICDRLPSPSIYLSLLAWSKSYYEVFFKWQVMLQLTVSSVTCPGHRRITHKTYPSMIYGACCASLHSHIPCVRERKSQVRMCEAYIHWCSHEDT